MLFKKFKPQVSSTTSFINDLINQGATLLKESATMIELQRMQSIASIDQYGRVTWREATPSVTSRPRSKHRK